MILKDIDTQLSILMINDNTLIKTNIYIKRTIIIKSHSLVGMLWGGVDRTAPTATHQSEITLLNNLFQ